MDNSCNNTSMSPLGVGDYISVDHPEDMLKPWFINPHFVSIMITHSLTFLVGVIGNIIIISTMTRDKTSRNATRMDN
uniref:G-protein coupled receptors family 1 profile domain-containing protein n=1 Tax=Strigamia maritima TaxID=126957 RepID=T1IXX9_STRMM